MKTCIPDNCNQLGYNYHLTQRNLSKVLSIINSVTHGSCLFSNPTKTDHPESSPFKKQPSSQSFLSIQPSRTQKPPPLRRVVEKKKGKSVSAISGTRRHF